MKEVEKGQECGLGLDVKFEVLPVSFPAMRVGVGWGGSWGWGWGGGVVLSRVIFTLCYQNDVMEAVVHSSRLQTIEEVWGERR